MPETLASASAARKMMVMIKELVFADLDREIAVTRRVLEQLPADQFAWKPHEKSMTLGQLALHVVNLLQWTVDTLDGDELDLLTVKPPPRDISDRDALLRLFDANIEKVRQSLSALEDDALTKTWTLRKGDAVLHTQRRVEIIRIWCINHVIHHRGQLCVLLRLLNVPVPVVYFNSADSPEWTFE